MMPRFIIATLYMILLGIPNLSEAKTPLLSKSDFDPMILKIKDDDYLGKTAPDIKFLDETGKTLSLSSFSKPLILLLIYYDCPVMCPLLGEGLTDALNNIGDLKAGSDYSVVVLSFNKDDTLEKVREFHKKLLTRIKSPSIDNWVFAITKEEEINRITEALGYRFFYSTEDKMFVHPSVYVFLSPERKITRYIFGIKPDSFNIRLAILESIKGRIGKVPISSLVTLACYKYDADSRGYLINLPVLFASVGVVMAVMTGILSFIVYRKRKSFKTN